jgi:hypothetical protein
MAYVQADILRLLFVLPSRSMLRVRLGAGEKMIERALLYRDTLEELYVEERPALCGTMHPDHG